MTETTEQLEKRLNALAPSVRMVTQKQAADFLGYSLTHLCNLNLYPMKDNYLPRVVMGNGRVFYLVEDLKRFLKKRAERYGR